MTRDNLPVFDRHFFEGTEEFTVIGSGSIGGKARGLADIREVLRTHLDSEAFTGVEIVIPTLTIIAADLFDRFMEDNGFTPAQFEDQPDYRIALAFQQADLPAQLVGDLQALMQQVRQPLAVRSSSILEDALYHPFAGVYETKMIPNNQHDVRTRFQKLVEAVKFVYGSTFYRGAREYLRAIGRQPGDEKMAVIIQEVVGLRRQDLFYPDLSGVARSYNFYPMGHARPKDGVVQLALGLGKTIVEGGRSWTYSPAFPRANPPYNDIGDLMKQTQTDFWAVNMGKPPAYDPTTETEYLVRQELESAEDDDVLGMLASTYSVDSDRMVMGTSATGPRVLTFAPLLVLERLPLNRAVTAVLSACEHALKAEVEIEFAVTFHKEGDQRARLGFLQVRPMVVSDDQVDLEAQDLEGEEIVVATESALGNGVVDSIQDVVYVRRDTFDSARTRDIASELEGMNRTLADQGRQYVLIGFGRWGTSDPWLGIPVQWGQIANAKVIVEAGLPEFQADPSQGSHFFHNVTSFRVLYFSVKPSGPLGIDWEWLEAQPVEEETRFLRRTCLPRSLRIAVDGRSGRGVIRR